MSRARVLCAGAPTLLLVLQLACSATAFYLPGVAPIDFEKVRALCCGSTGVMKNEACFFNSLTHAVVVGSADTCVNTCDTRRKSSWV